MKVRHFNTAFRASLLLFVAFCSSVALSEGEGTCYLTQYPSGEYVIRCEGDGIWVDYVEHTNEVYIIKNCEELKQQLSSQCLVLGDSLSNTISYASSVFYPAMESWVPTNGVEASSRNSAIDAFRDLESSSLFVVRGLTDPDFLDPSVNLYHTILDIECGSCSTNIGGGSCCDVDLTPILRRLNDANLTLYAITNILGSVVGGSLSYRYWNQSMNSSGRLTVINNALYRANQPSQYNVLNILKLMQDGLFSVSTSINNYLYKYVEHQVPNISNNLEIVMSTTTNLYIATTNHFSFFRSMTIQDSPLIDYSQQSTFDSYYDFLTNHYVKVSFKQYNGLVGDEKAKTNWFSRIETLLAALVFNDSEGTNTVDDTYGQSQQDNLINSLDGMNQTSTTQVNLMSNMGDNLLASLRSLNSSFSSAVSMPGEVKLATVGQDNSMQSNTIKFQSSEISQLVEACRCATTLAWCFGGIWLLFLFVSWSIKTSYSLCVFCWSVVSAIFGGGKT